MSDSIIITTQDIELTFVCSVCGESLNVKYIPSRNEVEVEPCSSCLSDSYNDGYNTGNKEE